ncbi:MAG TPA: FAD/NAD(P)-binding oxidoreductase [Chthoniobacterales bacterium]|jgi:NADPH-dependent 2,4-dienoyl-CoA reductase/sulfur reductase-like enzyme|nr:FAD/NAD(P)-binding oxidoreductase [Chthoniobacterales bacterium]
MIQRDYLIIGTGVGGASACEGVRKHDKRGSITIVGAEIMPTYHRWMLSKDFLREKTAPMKKLGYFDQRWFDSHKIETRFATVVKQFNIERRLAVLGNGESVEFNKACLAMGSRPVRPPVAGVNLGNVIYLRSVRDALALREMADVEKTVMVIGGGLLACETAASLRMMKLKVSMMHRNAYLLNRYLDSQTGPWLTEYFGKHGVTLLIGESLNGFEGKTVLRNIQTKSGNRVPAGLAVVCCGAEPNLDLVRNTPLSGPHGSPVTEYLETEEKGIFAVGDLAFYPDRIMGGVRRQTHWENARGQGLIAGANMTGKKRIRYEQIPYFWTEMFDIRMHFVGDFSMQPTRVDLRGTYAKRKFVAHYYQADKLRAILLCNQTDREVESAKKELRHALGK